MKLLPAAVILTVTIDVLLAVGHHEAVFKSVLQARRECSVHLRDGTAGRGECSTRCRGLVTRYWNDTLGFPAETINRFYQPAADDGEYYDLTEQCLGEVTAAIPVEDSCRRADCTVQCYGDQYGQLNGETAKFVPFTDLQHRRILKECVAMLGVPVERLALFVKHGIEFYQDAKCLLRCFMLREGHYTDDEGPDMERMSLQCEGNYNDEEFRIKARSCVRSLKEQYLDHCSLAYRIADECVNGEIAVKNIFLGTIIVVVPSDALDLLPSIPLPTIPGISLPTLIPNLSLPTLPSLLPNLTLPTLPTLIPTLPTITPPSVTIPTLPTLLPTILSTLLPSIPTALPTALPTLLPTALPTALPTLLPTALPTALPTLLPTALPTVLPTALPTALPTIPTVPTALPTLLPATTPAPTSFTLLPTLFPPIGK